MAEQNQEEKLTQAEFVKKAIVSLRKNPYKGIHSVYSGFNEAFRAYFNEDPIKWTNQVISTTGFGTPRSTKGVSCRFSPLETPSALSPPQEAGFTLNQLAAEGDIETRPSRKGIMLYLQ